MVNSGQGVERPNLNPANTGRQGVTSSGNVHLSNEAQKLAAHVTDAAQHALEGTDQPDIQQRGNLGGRVSPEPPSTATGAAPSPQASDTSTPFDGPIENLIRDSQTRGLSSAGRVKLEKLQDTQKQFTKIRLGIFHLKQLQNPSAELIDLIKELSKELEKIRDENKDLFSLEEDAPSSPSEKGNLSPEAQKLARQVTNAAQDAFPVGSDQSAIPNHENLGGRVPHESPSTTTGAAPSTTIPPGEPRTQSSNSLTTPYDEAVDDVNKWFKDNASNTEMYQTRKANLEAGQKEYLKIRQAIQALEQFENPSLKLKSLIIKLQGKLQKMMVHNWHFILGYEKDAPAIPAGLQPAKSELVNQQSIPPQGSDSSTKTNEALSGLSSATNPPIAQPLTASHLEGSTANKSPFETEFALIDKLLLEERDVPELNKWKKVLEDAQNKVSKINHKLNILRSGIVASKEDRKLNSKIQKLRRQRKRIVDDARSKKPSFLGTVKK